MDYSIDTRQELLQDLLDRKFNHIRDANHVNPSAVLVYDEESEVVSEVNILDLPLLYQCSGPGSRWGHEDLGKLVITKAQGYRQSVIAHSISEERPGSAPQCMTVLLWITKSYQPYRRLTIRSCIIPEETA